MKKNVFFIAIIKVLVVFALVGILSSIIDYFKMKSGNVPVFNLRKYDNVSKVQTFRGIFYKAERKVTASENESLDDSSEISFSFLFFNLDVPKQFKTVELPYTIETKEISQCNERSKLYYADKDIKVYTYCLDEINVNRNNKKIKLFDYLKKDNDIINDIDSKLSYLGLYEDQSTLMFEAIDGFTNNGLTMFRCHEVHINDVYIGPANTKFQDDFCTYKEDDFSFMYYLKEEPIDESPDNSNVAVDEKKEVIYEDENYRYEFDETKSDRIFVITPAVRGAEEKRYPIKQVIQNKMLTMEELAAKGLKFNKIDKKKEQEELLKKKAEEEAKKKAELENQQNNLLMNNQ